MIINTTVYLVLSDKIEPTLYYIHESMSILSLYYKERVRRKELDVGILKITIDLPNLKL